MKKCARCGNEAIFTVVEDKERISLCLYHYREEELEIMNENIGVAM